MEREPWMDWNPRFRDPDEETLNKMRKSVEDYERTQTREVFCPVCHVKLGTVQAERKGFLRTKCQNCKSTVPLDLRVFRRQRSRRRNDNDRHIANAYRSGHDTGRQQSVAPRRSKAGL